MNYFSVNVEWSPSHLPSDSHLLWMESLQQSFGPVEWTGTEDFSVEEKQVDRWIGDDAFCPTDCSPELLNEVESHVMEEEKRKQIFYFSYPSAFSWDEVTAVMQERLEGHPFSYSLEKLEEKNWNEEWQQYYQPQKVLDQWVVLPSWYKDQILSEDLSSRKKLWIYPAMAFGTGTHETTQLCLELFLLYKKNLFIDQSSEQQTLQRTQSKPKKYSSLDFGCGSGILGLMALAQEDLDWENVHFYDIDSLSLENTKNNLLLQDFSEEHMNSVKILESVSDVTYQYDLIWANLIYSVLLKEKNIIEDLLLPRGILIISGLLKEQEEDFLCHFVSSSFEVLDRREKGDWMAIIVRKIEKI
jgi:ribosomal protein L11 methyltransferase